MLDNHRSIIAMDQEYSSSKRATEVVVRAVIELTAEVEEDGERLSRFLAGLRPRIPAARLCLTLSRRALSPDLFRTNQEHLRLHEEWLSVRATGDELWVGPLFRPGTTACWACLAGRLIENCRAELVSGQPPASMARVARAIERYLADSETSRLCQLWEFPKGRSRPVVHIVARQPDCPTCGAEGLRASRRIRLQSRPKSPRSDRAASVAETLMRLSPHVSGLTGIVERPAYGGLPNGDQLCWATYNWVRAHLNPGTRRLHQVVGGAKNRRMALASCLAEAAERYSIEWRGGIELARARKSSLGPCAIGLRELGLWSRRQARNRKEWNRAVGGFSYLPPLPADDAEMDWVRVWSLTGRRWRYVPAAYCYLYYPGDPWFADSNGCAAGNFLEEAILYGFLELVERDAVAIWWYNRLRRRAVEPDNARSSALYSRAERALTEHGRSLAVLDLTSDFGIPVFAAVSARRDGTRIAMGTSARLNAHAALGGALRELFQTVVSVERTPLVPGTRASIVEHAIDRWIREATLGEHPYLVPENARSQSEFADLSTPDIRQDISFCLARARDLGLEVLALDMTRPELGFPVARVIVPGMRPWWGRFAQGRLYDVPVKMGWRGSRLRESELNPTAYFL
jgi:oxazoline/thiazoline synthase